LLRYALTRWFPEPGEVDVTRANQNIGYTPSGKINRRLATSPKNGRPKPHGRNGSTALVALCSASDTASAPI
jgi:hypothetical protein